MGGFMIKAAAIHPGSTSATKCNSTNEVDVMQVQRQFFDVKTRRVVIELPQSFVNHRVE